MTCRRKELVCVTCLSDWLIITVIRITRDSGNRMDTFDATRGRMRVAWAVENVIIALWHIPETDATLQIPSVTECSTTLESFFSFF